MSDRLAVAMRPRYPGADHPIHFAPDVMASLGDAIGAAAIGGMSDPGGLRVSYSGDPSELPEIARQAIASWLRCEVVVGEPGEVTGDFIGNVLKRGPQ